MGPNSPFVDRVPPLGSVGKPIGVPTPGGGRLPERPSPDPLPSGPQPQMIPAPNSSVPSAYGGVIPPYSGPPIPRPPMPTILPGGRTPLAGGGSAPIIPQTPAPDPFAPKAGPTLPGLKSNTPQQSMAFNPGAVKGDTGPRFKGFTPEQRQAFPAETSAFMSRMQERPPVARSPRPPATRPSYPRQA